ncbi:hypothetical protein D3C78_1131210 [compost metagenome]
MLHAAEQLRLIDTRFNECFCFGDDFDGLRVARFRGFAPSNKAMLLHQYELGIRVCQYALCNHLRQVKARANVWHPYEAVTEDFLRQRLAVIRTAQANNRIRVCMINMLEWKKRMKQSFNRSPRMLGINHAVSKISNHLLIWHFGALEQRTNILHTQAGKIARLHRCQIGAAAFYIHNLNIAAAEILNDCFARCIASAVVAYPAVCSNNVRAVNQLCQSSFKLSCFCLIPQTLYHGYTSE